MIYMYEYKRQTLREAKIQMNEWRNGIRFFRWSYNHNNHWTPSEFAPIFLLIFRLLCDSVLYMFIRIIWMKKHSYFFFISQCLYMTSLKCTRNNIDNFAESDSFATFKHEIVCIEKITQKLTSITFYFYIYAEIRKKNYATFS